MRSMNAFSSISSSSGTSIARRVLPSRLELNSPAGSSSDAPLKNVSFTTLLYVSPAQMMPPAAHTRPAGADVAAVRPPRPPGVRGLLPLEFLDHVGVGLLDQGA